MKKVLVIVFAFCMLLQFGVANQTKMDLLLEKCKSNDSVGCYDIAITYNLGDAVDQDKQKALEFFKQSCDLGYGRACFDLGLEKTALQDLDEAIDFYKKGCELKYAFSCFALAKEYIKDQKNARSKRVLSKRL